MATGVREDNEPQPPETPRAATYDVIAPSPRPNATTDDPVHTRSATTWASGVRCSFTERPVIIRSCHSKVGPSVNVQQRNFACSTDRHLAFDEICDVGLCMTCR